ncbi:Uncharacterized protein FWK35_00016093, partial [Aphis craccivora]
MLVNTSIRHTYQLYNGVNWFMKKIILNYHLQLHIIKSYNKITLNKLYRSFFCFSNSLNQLAFKVGSKNWTSSNDLSLILNEVMNVLILQLCVFFLCVCVCVLITIRNNAPISNYEGGFRCNSEYPWCIIEVKIQKNQEKQKKNDGKTGISIKSTFLYGFNSKTNHCKYLKFSKNCYQCTLFVDLPYEFSNFYEICRKRENLQ